MREIIHIQTGQCGNQIGTHFWNTLLKEHKISNEGFRQQEMEDNLDVYFSEAQNKKFVPRCVLIDLEPGTQESIKSSELGKLFKPDNFIFGSGGAGNNWAKGHYTEGAEIIDNCLEAIRRESEICEMMQGFQICHSLGGGTGSGLGTLLLTKLREDFPDRMINTFSIVPSPKVSDTIVEPYNATLSIHQLVENTDGTILIDNAALYNLCTKKLKIKEPSYANMNNLVATVMSGITTSLRFPSHLNADLRKLFVNMVPFPRLHFFLPGQAPLFESESSQYMNLNTNDLINQLLNGPLMAEGDMTNGRYLAVSAIFRGEFNIHAIDEIIYKKRADNFVSWIPNSIKIATCSVKPLNGDISATFLANTTAVQEIYNRIISQFSSMFKRKAFLHWYISEGMDEMEFTEAESNLKDLLNEYVQYQNEE